LRVLLLGIGAVGTVTATHLANCPEVSEVVLGDIALERSKQLADRLKSSKVSALRVDAGNRENLTSAMKKTDVVINAALPKFNFLVMDVALKNKVNYLDLASDIPYDSVRNQLKLSKKWKAADMTAIMGLGEDPGLSNLFARYLADKLDSVEEIRIRDGDTGVSPDYAFPCLFSPDVLIDEVLNQPEIFKDGSLLRLPPLSGQETYSFPEPVSSQTVYLVDHEEPETLSRFINKGLRYVDFKLSLSPQIVEMLKVLRQLNLTSKEPIDVKGVKIAPKDLLLALLPKPADLAGKVEGFSCITVDMIGKKAGRKIRALAYAFISHQDAYKKYGVTGTAYLTGTPPAVGAVMLAKGEIEERGVIPPECLKPLPILKEIEKKGIKIHEKMQEI
jgi:saccharopine dehydrogenase (NAD+, L-lysine-forming)